ncbi:hypothetical protein BWI93_03185 [Siphonobacter sp. BAB-5385]|nr:hypothetical protein BWI93_03185 [Siphonobacter sp. BAB-5385]
MLIMTKDEITKAVIEVISQNSRYTVDEIKVPARLDKYISSSSKARLGRRLGEKFSMISSTLLTNKLYASLTTVESVIDYIDALYNPIVLPIL